MTLARFTATVQDGAGTAIAGAQIEVRSETTGRLVQVYSDRSGTQALGNPFLAPEATFFFHAKGAPYRVKATKGSLVQEWRYVGVGTMAEQDVGDIVFSLEAGIYPAATLADLQSYSPEIDQPVGGVVWNDPVPANNGYYLHSGSGWAKQRGLPDTFARLVLTGGSPDAVTAVIDEGVDPADVQAFFAFATVENTGPMTLEVNGEDPRAILSVMGEQLTGGEWVGSVMVARDGDSYRLLFDAYGASRAAQSADRAADSAAEARIDADRSEAAKDVAQIAADELRSLYLGSFASDAEASAAADGAPVSGQMYWNTSSFALRVWEGVWRSTGITYAGTWSSTPTYVANSAVEHGGSVWVARRENVGIAPAEGLDWALFMPGVSVADGSVTAPKVAPRAVLASKLDIGDTSNGYPDPNLSDPSQYSGAGTYVFESNSDALSPGRLRLSLRANDGQEQVVLSPAMQVDYGASYFCGARYGVAGNNPHSGAELRVLWFSNREGTGDPLQTDSLPVQTTGAARSVLTAQVLIAPALASACRFAFVRRPSSVANSTLFSAPVFRRVVQPTLREISPMDFGAIGNGVADDTAAVQACVSDGRPVSWLDRIYRITAPVTLTSTRAVAWRSGGATVLVDSSSSIQRALFVSMSGFDFELRGDLTIDGQMKCFTGLDVRNTGAVAKADMLIDGIKVRNIYRANTSMPNGDGVFCLGNFRKAIVQNFDVRNVVLAAGAGVSGSVGVAGVTVTRSNTDQTDAELIVIQNGTVDRVWSEDPSYRMDQDGIRAFNGYTFGTTFSRPCGVVIKNVRLSNCMGRAIKLQAEDFYLSDAYVVRDASIHGAYTGNYDIDSQVGAGTIRNVTFRYTGSNFPVGPILFTTTRDSGGDLQHGNVVIDNINVIENTNTGRPDYLVYILANTPNNANALNVYVGKVFLQSNNTKVGLVRFNTSVTMNVIMNIESIVWRGCDLALVYRQGTNVVRVNGMGIHLMGGSSTTPLLASPNSGNLFASLLGQNARIVV